MMNHSVYLHWHQKVELECKDKTVSLVHLFPFTTVSMLSNYCLAHTCSLPEVWPLSILSRQLFTCCRIITSTSRYISFLCSRKSQQIKVNYYTHTLYSFPHVRSLSIHRSIHLPVNRCAPGKAIHRWNHISSIGDCFGECRGSVNALERAAGQILYRLD